MKPLCMCAFGLEADHFFNTLAICVTVLNLSESCGWELEIEFAPAHQGFDSPAAVDK